MLTNHSGKIIQKTKSMLGKVVKRDHLARTTTKKVIEIMPRLKEGCISAPNLLAGTDSYVEMQNIVKESPEHVVIVTAYSRVC